MYGCGSGEESCTHEGLIYGFVGQLAEVVSGAPSGVCSYVTNGGGYHGDRRIASVVCDSAKCVCLLVTYVY